MCWPADSLAFKEGEDRIQLAWRSALVGPPARTPIKTEPIPPAQRLAIRRVKLPRGVKLVALTFDLCEQPHEVSGYQGEIVDYLRKHKIRATFFAGGKWMLTHRDRAQQLMADPLFEIGNHTWEHRNLRLLTGLPLAKEILSAQTAYEQVREDLETKQCLSRDGRPATEGVPTRPTLFRFPFGACNAEALNAVGEMGLKAIQWDVSSGDPWTGQNPELMARTVQTAVKPGSIILFHANGRGWHTPSALPSIVQALKEKGYGFVTVSELLERGEPVYSAACYDTRPGDTDRYDKLAARLTVVHERWRRKILSEPAEAKSPPAPVLVKRPNKSEPIDPKPRQAPAKRLDKKVSEPADRKSTAVPAKGPVTESEFKTEVIKEE
jgi:peptidoglycan/xylan/chitin deacetylase (PgdA/CDA1 family)